MDDLLELVEELWEWDALLEMVEENFNFEEVNDEGNSEEIEG